VPSIPCDVKALGLDRSYFHMIFVIFPFPSGAMYDGDFNAMVVLVKCFLAKCFL
jgi:hypothetical protein